MDIEPTDNPGSTARVLDRLATTIESRLPKKGGDPDASCVSVGATGRSGIDILGGHHHLGRLFANLLQKGVRPTAQQSCHIAGLGIATVLRQPALDRDRQSVKHQTGRCRAIG